MIYVGFKGPESIIQKYPLGIGCTRTDNLIRSILQGLVVKKMVKFYIARPLFLGFLAIVLDVLGSLEPFATVFMCRKPIF